MTLCYIYFIISLFFICFCECTTCSGTVNGTSYDLSSLTYNSTDSSPPGYSIVDNYDNTFYINFCEEVSQYIGNNECNKNFPAGSCQLSSGNYFNAGSDSSGIFVSYVSDGTYTEGVGLQYTGGDFCNGQAIDRQTTIYVSCTSNEDGLYKIHEDGCIYTLYFGSTVVCSPSKTPSVSITNSPSSTISFTPSPTISPSSSTSIIPKSISTEIDIAILVLVCILIGMVASVLFFLILIFVKLKKSQESQALLNN